jgi:hypothetical protein
MLDVFAKTEPKIRPFTIITRITVFELQSFIESAECINCGKTAECLLVSCQRGTFAGPLCPKCLVRESKKRSRNSPSAKEGSHATTER